MFSTSTTTSESIIYHASRGDDFLMLLRKLLSLGNLKTHYITLLTSNDALKVYQTVFTAKSANPIENYEFYEQLGDVTANKFLIWYMYRRFPFLKSSEGVQIVARLRIKYSSKECFAQLAEEYGFWNFISASEDERNRNKKHLLEDVFEAFLGATEYLIDTNIRLCTGYSIVYDILSTIFEKKDIPLKYDILCDAKTRLKELVDYMGLQFGSIKYINSREKEQKIATSTLFHIGTNGIETQVGIGKASLKADAEQRGALQALDYFKRKGIQKPLSPLFLQFE